MPPIEQGMHLSLNKHPQKDLFKQHFENPFEGKFCEVEVLVLLINLKWRIWMIWKRRAKKEDKSSRRLSLLEECFTAGRCEAAGYLAKLANEPATVPHQWTGAKPSTRVQLQLATQAIPSISATPPTPPTPATPPTPPTPATSCTPPSSLLKILHLLRQGAPGAPGRQSYLMSQELCPSG